MLGLELKLTKYTKSKRELSKVLKSNAEIQSFSNLKNKEANELLLITANATQQLIDSTKKVSQAQKESNKETGIFGKFVQNLLRDFEVLGIRIGIIASSIGSSFGIMVVKFRKSITDFKIENADFINSLVDIFNFFADEGEKIDYIDVDGLKKKSAQAQNEIENLQAVRDRSLGQSSVGIFGDLAVTSAELKSLQAVLLSSGPAYDELTEFLGTDDINSFAKQLELFRATGDESSFTNEKLLNTLKGLTNGFNEDGEALGTLNAELLQGQNLVDLFAQILETGTKNTRLSGQAVDELSQTFINSGQKLNEFFNSFKKQAQVGPVVSELDNINKIINNITKGQDGDVALFKSFEEAPASLKRVLDNTQEIADAQEELNGLDKNNEANLERIKELEGTIGVLRKTAFEDLTKLTKELMKQQLFDEAKLKSLKQQENAVKKGAKANVAGTTAQIQLSNKQNNMVKARLENELKLQEDNLTLASKKLIEEGKIDELSKDQLEVYAKIGDTKQAISEVNEKLIGEEEASALIAQQKLELTKSIKNIKL